MLPCFSHYLRYAVFKFKDRVPEAVMSGVIYQFTCPFCKKGYIGSTTRHLYHRYCEHKGISDRDLTLRHVDAVIDSHFPRYTSTIRDHSIDNSHGFAFSDFEILKSVRANNKYEKDTKLLIVESLFLNELQTEINVQKTAYHFVFYHEFNQFSTSLPKPITISPQADSVH